MELRPEQLAGQSSQPLQPVYLIAGPETLRVLEAADAVRARARAEGIGEREVFDADGREFDWNQLDASFNAPSLFSPRRLVEVRLPSGKPGKDGAEVISRFCANPPPDVVLLITANDWSKAHHGKWAEAVGRIGTIAVAWAIKPHELSDWIERRLRAHGLRADAAAVQRLSERVEGNLLAAAQEIDKLALLADGKTLDLEAMESLVADAARYDVFRLAETTFSGQPAAVIRPRCNARTCHPASRSCRASSPPMPPLAPSTRAVAVCVMGLLRCRDAASVDKPWLRINCRSCACSYTFMYGRHDQLGA